MAKKSVEKKTIYPKLLPGQETFSTFDTARILNLNRERLRQWAIWNFIPHGTKVAWGKGYKVVWSRYQLYTISLFQKLMDAGLSRKGGAACIEAVHWDEVKDSDYKYFVLSYSISTKEHKPIFVKKRESLKNLGDEEIAVFINLEEIMRDIDSRV